MDVLVNCMDKMIINVSSLTILYYVLNGYNHNFCHQDLDATENKSIFCSCINILYGTFLKPVSMCDPYYENKVDVNISFICEDIKEK